MMNGELRMENSEFTIQRSQFRTGAERRFVYENVSFDYHLICEVRKTVAASVLPSQAIVLRAPINASEDRIEDFLRRKFRWVLKQRRYFAQFKVRCKGAQYSAGMGI